MLDIFRPRVFSCVVGPHLHQPPRGERSLLDRARGPPLLAGGAAFCHLSVGIAFHIPSGITMLDIVTLVWCVLLAGIATSLSILYWDHRARKYHQPRYYTGHKITPTREKGDMISTVSSSSSSSSSGDMISTVGAGGSSSRSGTDQSHASIWEDGSSPAQVARHSRVSRSQPSQPSPDTSFTRQGESLQQPTPPPLVAAPPLGEPPPSQEQQPEQEEESLDTRETPPLPSTRSGSRASFIDDLAELSHRVFGGGGGGGGGAIRNASERRSSVPEHGLPPDPGESRRHSMAGRIEAISEWSSEDAPALAPAGRAPGPTQQARSVPADAVVPSEAEARLAPAAASPKVAACEAGVASTVGAARSTQIAQHV